MRQRKMFLGMLAAAVCTVVLAQSAFAATYYISTTGDNDNSGTSTDAPFLSIQRAAQIAGAGDTILIEGGVYRETVTPGNSGTAGAPITYAPYPGEYVVVSGLDPVADAWTDQGGGIYKAVVPMALDHENQVFHNGEMMLEARWPNSTNVWNRVQSVAEGGTTVSKLMDSALPSYDWSGAIIWIRQDPAWSIYPQQVLGYGSGYLDTENNSYWSNHELRPGSSYYVQGCLDALDVEGEWYYDSASASLYAHTGGGSPGSSIEIKKRLNAFELNNRSYLELRGLHIKGATLSMDNGSHHITMDGLNIQYPYLSDRFLTGLLAIVAQNRKGVVLDGDHHVFKNCELGWSSGSGVKLAGNNIHLINNYIHDCNFVGSFVAAPLALGSHTEGGVVSHNTITAAGRECMTFPKNMADYLIQHNDISHAGQLTEDLGMNYGGVVEGGGTEIRYNWFHDSDAAVHGTGHGIYFDHGSKNLLVHHNAVWGVWYGIVINQYALNILMFNNTVTASGNSYQSTWGNQWPSDMYGCMLVNNVFSSTINSTGEEIAIADNSTWFSGLIDNKYLPNGSEPVDSGQVIPGITDGYVGVAPDRGAYENGGFNWQAGHDFGTEPVVDLTRSSCLYLNRIENSCFERSGLDPWVAVGSDVSINHEVVNQGVVLTNTAMGGLQSVLLGTGINRIEQAIDNLLPDTTYEFRGRLRVDGGETAVIGVEGHGNNAVVSSVVSNNAPYWSDTRITFQTGSASTTATIYAGKTSAGSGAVYVDDFSVIPFIDTDSDGVPDPLDLDDDNDALPDSWEVAHGLDPLVPNLGDSDGDGASDYKEYIARTHPLDSTSVFQITGMVSSAMGDEVDLGFTTANGLSYQIEFTDNLFSNDWYRVGATLQGTGGILVARNLPSSAPASFYRISLYDPTEDFESYAVGTSPAGSNGWTSTETAFQTTWVKAEASSPFGTGFQGVHFYDQDGSAGDMDLINTFSATTNEVVLTYDFNLVARSQNPGLTVRSGNGTQAVYFRFSLYNGTSQSYYDGAWNYIVPVAAGKWYRNEMTIRSSDDTFDLKVWEWNSGSASLVADLTGLGFRNAVGDIESFEFETAAGGGSSGGNYYIDNVKVISTP